MNKKNTLTSVTVYYRVKVAVTPVFITNMLFFVSDFRIDTCTVQVFFFFDLLFISCTPVHSIFTFTHFYNTRSPFFGTFHTVSPVSTF
jgi:hypothetical protein